MTWEQGRDALSRIFTRRNFGVAFLFILFAWLTPDAYDPSPGLEAGLEYRFSIIRWEAANLPAKWLNIAHGLATGRSLDRAQRLEVVDEYVVEARAPAAFDAEWKTRFPDRPIQPVPCTRLHASH